MFRMLLAEMNA